MKEKIVSYFGSIFDNYSQGASMRKILAFLTGAVFAGYLHYAYVDTSNAFQFLIADLACALLCLGIITMEQVIKFKGGGGSETTETTTLPPSEEEPKL